MSEAAQGVCVSRWWGGREVVVGCFCERAV